MADALAKQIEADRAEGSSPVCARCGNDFNPWIQFVPSAALSKAIMAACRRGDVGTAMVAPNSLSQNGAELADSYNFNPHKWMGATRLPFSGCGSPDS
jgi:hypothetical protein